MSMLQSMFGLTPANSDKRVKVHHRKKIYIASDHAGYHLKQKIKNWLINNKINFEDSGNLKYDPNDDYPRFAIPLAKRIVKEKTYGILVCGSAQGMCIAANKVKGARAIIPFSFKEARLGREHEDANIVCLSEWFFSYHYCTQIISRFVSTPFTNEERHLRRLKEISKLER